MNIDAKLHQILNNLDRTLPPEFHSVDDLVRAIDARPPGELDAWLDKLAPVTVGDEQARLKAFRAAMQAAAALSQESGVPLAELKRRAVGRVGAAAVQVDARVPVGPGFLRPGDAVEQQQRLDVLKRDFAAKARAAGAPLMDIGLDEQFKSAGQAKAYMGQLLAGDMLYWARNAFEETARMEQSQTPAQLRAVIVGIDYSHFTGGGGPYHDFLVTKLDNNFAVADIVDVLSHLKYHRFPISVKTQVDVLLKLLDRREGDGAAIEAMLREVQATARDDQSSIVAHSFLARASERGPAVSGALERLGYKQNDLAMYGTLTSKEYPDRSALESLAAMAAARPAFKAFEEALPKEQGRRVSKEGLLAAIDAEIAKMKSPEEFVAFGLAFTGERYKYQFRGGPYSDRDFNILWDVMKRHPDTAAKLGVSFDWMAALTFAAYFQSMHMAQSGILFEDAMKVLEPLMAHLKTPEQLDRLMASCDLFIQKTYINNREHYPKNYEEAWYKLRNAALSRLIANFSSPQDGPQVVARCGTVDAAIKAKQRMMQLAGDDLRGLLSGVALHFSNPSEAYLKDNERFVLDHLRHITGHRAFDRGTLEALLAVQSFSRPAQEAILRATEAAPNFVKWSAEDQAAARALLAAA